MAVQLRSLLLLNFDLRNCDYECLLTVEDCPENYGSVWIY
jgi:hypothetical protein